MEAIVDIIVSLLASLGGADVQRKFFRGYKKLYRRASRTGDWSEGPLIALLRKYSISGPHSDRSDSQYDRALRAWRERVDPVEAAKLVFG